MTSHTVTSEELWALLNTEDDRVRAGLCSLGARRRAALAAGARRVGWKVGLNDVAVRRRLGVDAGVVGYLLDDTVVRDGLVSTAGTERLLLEMELALEVGVAPPSSGSHPIIRVASALEVLDVSASDVEHAIAANVWHHAVVFGEPCVLDADVAAELAVTVTLNGGEPRSLAPPTSAQLDLDAIHRFVASGVNALGESLEPGDWIIDGNLDPSPTWVANGDRIDADFGPLGHLTLQLTD